MTTNPDANDKLTIHLRSDLHHEFLWPFLDKDLPPEDVDVIILAGDIDVHCDAFRWASTLGAQVIYVAGNHEFYYGKIEDIEYRLRLESSKFGRVTFLNNASTKIGNVRFLGTTLWTDYAITGDTELAMACAKDCLSDHRLIAIGDEKAHTTFTPQHARFLHFRAIDWLKSELSKTWAGKTVVITHHAPHRLSISRRYEGSVLNPAYVSDLSEILSNFDIDIWMHGHMHEPCDYTVYNTRIICNPRGYEGSGEEFKFNPDLRIEI